MTTQIDAAAVSQVVQTLEQGGSIADAMATISSSDSGTSNTLAMLGAVNTLASQVNLGQYAKIQLGTLGAVLNIGGLAQNLGDGSFSLDDLAALSGVVGAVLARNPIPVAQAWAAYFNLFALAPTFGRWLGQKIPLPSEINDWYLEALGWLLRRDPLTLDLDGDGFETLPADGTILFDHDGDGIKNGSGWVAPDDGLLVLDKNGNGLIDNGNELFGDNTLKSDGTLALNGFDALADLDSNNDGVIDSSDNQFNNLRVWQDANSDGISQSGELHTLNSMGITAINLESEAATLDVGNGNIASATGTFERSDGSEGVMQSAAANLDLASNPFCRKFMNLKAVQDQL